MKVVIVKKMRRHSTSNFIVQFTILLHRINFGWGIPRTVVQDTAEYNQDHHKNYYEYVEPELPVEILGHIQRPDVEQVLETQARLAYNDSKTIFGSISKFIVPYEWSLKKDDEKIHMLEALSKVTEHNLGSRNTGGNQVTILISITPKGSITDDLNRVSDIINQTNTKFPGTISHLLLQYGSLRLNSEAIPFVREDIAGCNKYVKTFNDISNVTCGIVLDGRNCEKDEEKVLNLGIPKDNVVIFDPRETTEEGFNAKLLLIGRTCVVEMYQKAIIGIKQPTPATFNLESGRFEVKTNIHGNVSDALKFYVYDIELLRDGNKTTPVNETNTKYHKLDEEWLRRPVELSKLNFGVTLNPAMVTAPDSMIPHMVGTFRTIVLENPGEPSTAERKRQYDLAENIAYLAKQLNSREAISDDQKVFGDGIPVQIILSLTIYHDTWEPNKRAVEAALSAAMKTNKIYPGIVRAIQFEWNSCFQSDICQPIKDVVSLRKYLYKHYKLLESVFLYARHIRGSSPIALGIVLEKEIIYDSSYYMLTPDALFHVSIFSQVDFFVYKVNVAEDELLEQGALGFSQSFIPTLGPFRIIVESILILLKIPFPSTTMYKIKVSGCGKDKRSGSIAEEQTRVAEYARFWEIMNNWGMFENASVIIDTAFEEAESVRGRDCRGRSPVKQPKGCACGWWRLERRNLSDDDIEGRGVTMTDKKMIAAQIHDARIPQKFTPPQAPLSIWSISMLLVLAALITVVVGTFAAYMGKRHRSAFNSDGGLTRKDLKSFFKGDSSQLRNLERNLHGENSRHADSQPYQKERYELTPTSFKIGSRCLGEGEFGVVFSCTLLRGMVEKEVAVKIINKRTTSGGGQTHARYLALKGLISEIKLMSYIGEHDHLVKLEGAYTAKLKKGEVMVFTEYCEMGSLEKYLREAGTTSNDIEILPSELSNDLHRWAGEIASGMEFLASKNVVHADLATRNVLLNSQKIAKVSDFGLSRRLYDYSEYLKTEQGPLPWRWMAPESLRKMIFNEKSDVWSFGVTLWEMYTLGDMPYPGLSWDVEFPVMLDGGVRLHEPRWNEKNMYSIMKKCWERIPNDRPQFSEIYLMLNANQ